MSKNGYFRCSGMVIKSFVLDEYGMMGFQLNQPHTVRWTVGAHYPRKYQK